MMSDWFVSIPLRSGVLLSATVYLPPGICARKPAVLVLTPYVAQVHHDQGRYFSERGYPFVCADVRGRGNSEGSFHPLNDIADLAEVIDWVAKQPYCDGKVAMWGGSYSGYLQWAAAKTNSRHLSTIVPVSAPYRGGDSPMRNNIWVPYLMRWLTYLHGRTAQEKIFADQPFWATRFREWFESGVPFRQLDTFLGSPSPLFQEWLAHPHEGPYWDQYNPTSEEYARLSMPVLTITGMYDADQPGALRHYREHVRSSPRAREQHYLVIGPWDHSGTRNPRQEFGGLRFGRESLVDLSKLHLEWYC
jgi:uncharacterized protein